MLTDFFQFMLWTLWFFVWISAVMIWFQCITDLFRDHTLSGWGKAAWSRCSSSCPGSAGSST